MPFVPAPFRAGFKGVSIVVWEAVDELDCPNPDNCAFPTGQSVLDYLSFDGGDTEIWFNVWILVRN